MKSILFISLLALTAAAGRAAETPLVIDPTQSRVEVGVQATVDSFTGKLIAYDAAIVVDLAQERITSARFAFHFADVRTGNTDRDDQMNEWQDTPHHPDGVFVLSSLTSGADGRLTAHGKLTLHDRTRVIAFPVSITHEGERYSLDGDATLDTREFGLPIIRKVMFLKVDPEVHVRFHLQGRPAAEPAS